MPLGGGTDGKSPLLPIGRSERTPLKQVLGVMHGRASATYGVLLDRLVVVDCDERDECLVKEMEARFGASPVHVRTPRGIHLYYSGGNRSYPNLRREGLPVDVKAGATSYVVGPGSVRPDGGGYEATKGVLGATALPRLQVPASVRRAGVPEGNRHWHLVKVAISQVEAVTSAHELADNLRFERDENCFEPSQVSDDEVEDIATWAWEKRLQNNIYAGRKSEFRLDRSSLDLLKSQDNASDAIALFVTLQDLHGHRPGKTFCLDHESMRSSGHTDLSRRRFRAARDAIQAVGLIEVAQSHRAAHHQRKYRLRRAISTNQGFPCLISGQNRMGGGVY